MLLPGITRADTALSSQARPTVMCLACCTLCTARRAYSWGVSRRMQTSLGSIETNASRACTPRSMQITLALTLVAIGIMLYVGDTVSLVLKMNSLRAWISQLKKLRRNTNANVFCDVAKKHFLMCVGGNEVCLAGVVTANNRSSWGPHQPNAFLRIPLHDKLGGQECVRRTCAACMHVVCISLGPV